ncbi:hypothetical protein SAMN05444392_102349 [Seinonella peptonophila]|uniref:DUF2269 domain-containing protein n=1 Tax=Seinonella peptonophila TaxID=112248 RepID=A0A1M4VG89_9BACL|nr:hypothetical protein [Seinonella peptonophila]SHE67981.1 hypothetical protein SAMN05444392_102349 [Seinonella peptonophila]
MSRKQRLSQKKKQWLVILHVLLIFVWFSGSITTFTLGVYVMNVKDGAELLMTYDHIHMIDLYLIRFPALGVLISGVILSIWTHWGLTKYYWVMTKEVLTILVIVLGSFGVNTWVTDNVMILFAHESGSFVNSQFAWNQSAIIMTSIIQLSAMIFMTMISYLKPWGKRRQS